MTATKLKVLIVEDEFILFDELVDFFEEKGFEVLLNDRNKAVDSYEEAVRIMETHLPDLAILDVKLKGSKDGIELGAFIKEYFFTPVIFLSAYSSFMNVERAKSISANGFVMKAQKPFDKEQLWISVRLIMPLIELRNKRKALGKPYKVKDINPLNYFTSQFNKQYKRPEDPIEKETIIKWDDIIYIRSSNTKDGKGNNNLLLQSETPTKGFLLRKTLSEIEHELPPYFTRVNQSAIINVKKITEAGKTEYQYYIHEDSFVITDTYREHAIKVIRLFLDDSRYWMIG